MQKFLFQFKKDLRRACVKVVSDLCNPVRFSHKQKHPGQKILSGVFRIISNKLPPIPHRYGHGESLPG